MPAGSNKPLSPLILVAGPFRYGALWRWTALLVIAVVSIRLAWIGDDAAITLRSVLNLAHGYGPNFNLDERVQSYTHPLWFLLISGVYLLFGGLFSGVIALSAICTLVAVWLMTRLRDFSLWTLTALCLLLFSRSFMDYTISGLEAPLAFLVMALFVHVLMSPALPRREVLLVLLGGLGYLTRPDLILLTAPAIFHALFATRSPRAIVSALLIGGLPVLLWSGFALFYYGFLFPNTAYAKLNTGIPQGELLLQGLRYFIDSLNHDPITLTGIVFAAVSAWRGRTMAARLLALGILLYLLYVLKIGGDFMSGRFFAVPLFTSALLLALRPAEEAGRGVPMLLAALLLGSGGNSPVRGALDNAVPMTDWVDGIIDERGFYYARHSLASGDRNRFFEAIRWPDRADTSGEIADVVMVRKELGYEALASGPLVHYIDPNALTDPLLARMHPSNGEWRIGHFSRYSPKGYVESILHNDNRLTDSNLRKLYAEVRLLTRAPLLSDGRMAAILRANLFGLAAEQREAASPRPIELGLASLAQPKADGSQWNAAGNVVFQSEQPVNVALPGRSHATAVELSVDHNDYYRLVYLRDGTYCGESEPFFSADAPPGLKVHRIQTPRGIANGGFDGLEVEGFGGDGLYAVGHLILDPSP